MVDNFSSFSKLVAARFQEMVAGGDVFVVDVSGDVLWETYLAAFSAGTNPLFRKRTEHDCSCCRSFVRRVGNVVSLVGGKVRTVWDSARQDAPPPYADVAYALREKVKAGATSDLFRVGAREAAFGAATTRSLDEGTGDVHTWHHFHTDAIPQNLRVASPDQARGDYRTTVQVFERGLTELSPEAVATVLSLVEANALYRGEEHRPALLSFQKAQREYLDHAENHRSRFVWTNAGSPAARFRNTVIGTLVQDLSEGVDVERAVKSFETKVAPQNYKRPTAIITPGMVKKAMEAIGVLGLEPALERRFAVIGDISVNDVKWVDGAARPRMKGGLGDALMEHAAAASPSRTEADEKRAETIGLDDFVARVLPEATGVEILLKSENLGNLVSLTAPVHPEPARLFRWKNDFAWSYGGNVADSIKERVKAAGGRVDGAVLRVSLSWFNFDDLDLHVYEPEGRGIRGVLNHISFRNRRGWTGGELDVDMNAGGGTSRAAVENIFWLKPPPDGAYKVVVNNFALRETADPGFVIEVESGGKLSHFSYNKIVRNREDVPVCTLHVQGGKVVRVEAGHPGVTASNVSQTKWGLSTEQYQRVSAVVLSPNYWGENRVGNKHTFFILEKAKNDEPCRGFYNEFLHPRLEPYRKVFEVIGDKTKCRPSDEQMSGVGFSSTKPASFVVRVHQGKRQRLFEVKVGA